MNPDTPDEAVSLASEMEKTLSSLSGVEIAIAPPFPFLAIVAHAVKKISLGAQDITLDALAALTGGVSWRHLRALGVRMVIVGHSERRLHCGESDEVVNQKVHTALSHGLEAVLCVGERERDGGDIPAAVSDAVRSALAGVKKSSLKNVIIAYEPAWAISTAPGGGQADVPARIFRARLTIEKAVADAYDPSAAHNVRIIYGGSVRPDNIGPMMDEGRMDGVLIGGASLDTIAFAAIAERVAEARR
jgi:triosephosphate isomerase